MTRPPLDDLEVAMQFAERLHWKSDGVTPHATIYSAMIREISKRGKESRFKKTGRGKFTARTPK